MARASNQTEYSSISEMAIVDTFTKLIFGEGADFSTGELYIIRALRLADTSLMADSLEDMGGYLRTMGVAEMVGLVARVREQLLRNPGPSPEEVGQIPGKTPAAAVRHQGYPSRSSPA